MVEFMHDDGRLIIRQLAAKKWIGIRTRSGQVIRGKSAKALQLRHDLLEAGERMERAAMNKVMSGHSRKNPKLIQLHRFQREWMTRLWY